MKQGQANKTDYGAQKREPIPHKVNPAGVDQLGQAMGTRRSSVVMQEGRAYQAPGPTGCSVHRSGSQGKHK